MKTLLVPTDFSTCAGGAINFAVELAKLSGADLALLHVCEISETIFSDQTGLNAETNRELMETANRKLLLHKDAIEAAENIRVTTHLFTGSVNASITQAATDLDADLIVMGTVGMGNLTEKIWGRTATHQIGKSGVPVMIIPLQYEAKKIDNVLLATNHFEEQEYILNPVVELADLFLSRLHVAVFTDTRKDSAGKYLEQEKMLDAYKTMLLNRYGEDSLAVSHLAGSDFEQSLQQYVEEQGIDLLVMITYQQNFISQLFSTSQTRKMAYHTNIPLLVIPGEL